MDLNFWSLIGFCLLMVVFCAILYSISCLDVFLEKCRKWLEEDNKNRW